MKNIAKLLPLLALLLGSAAAHAQADVTLYHMRDLPLSNRLNPAFQPKNGSIYIAIPVIPLLGAPTGLGVSATGKNITYQNLMSDKPNYGAIVSGIDKFAVGQFNFDYTPISFGFMVKDMYFSLDLSLKAHFEGRVPKGMIDLIYYGNGAESTLGKEMSLEGLGGTGYAYGELALGFSKEIAPLDLIVGGKLKYLQGGAYAQTSFGKNSYITTDPKSYHITAGIDPEMYMAGLPGSLPSGNVMLDSIVGGIDFDLDSYVFKSDNRGFAIDLGGTWNVGNVVDQPWAKKLEVSASLIDLGFISWKGNKVVKAKDASDSFTFEGMNMNGGINFLNSLTDSVMNTAKVESAGNASFRKWLSPTLYVGASYHIAKYLNAGMLLGCRFGTYENLPLVAASINTQSLPVNASLSASYFDGKGNLGFGIIFGRRACQFHIITDNILAANYQKTQAINLRMGMNVLVGKTRDKRKEAAAAGGELLAPEAVKTGAPLNPVQQEGAAGTKVESGDAPVQTTGNTKSDEELLKRALEEEKAEAGEKQSEPSAEELLKRAIEEEKAEAQQQ
jgi:hypothetical protein